MQTETQVRRLAAELKLPLRWALRWAMRSPERLSAFGNVSVVATLLVFDSRGRLAGAHDGAQPTLHHDAEATINRAMTATGVPRNE